MRSPLLVLALRQADRVRTLEADRRRLLAALARANDTTDRALRAARGWQSRAEALWFVSDPDLRDGVGGVLHDIDSLEERR